MLQRPFHCNPAIHLRAALDPVHLLQLLVLHQHQISILESLAPPWHLREEHQQDHPQPKRKLPCMAQAGVQSMCTMAYPRQPALINCVQMERYIVSTRSPAIPREIIARAQYIQGRTPGPPTAHAPTRHAV